MIQVVTTSIPFSKKELEDDIKKVASFAHTVQVDISDGIFTKVTTWPYNGKDTDFFENLKKESKGWPHWQEIDIELHLMVKNPENVVSEWLKTGVSSIVAHIEASDDFQKLIDVCRQANISVGVALKPSTPIEKIALFVEKVDFIQCMGSDLLGEHGIELEDKALERIKELRKVYPEVIIGVDIGVNLDTAETLVKAGANKLISGSAILKAENPKEVFEYFQSLG